MAIIFISYRRKDTAGYTGRLARDLSAYLGKTQIYRDIDEMKPGTDFVESIKSTIESCDIAIIMIGPNWTGKNTDGSSRINDPNDYVRLEVEASLARGILVIPVLVDGAIIPSRDDLPQSMWKLTHLQAVQLSESIWDVEVDRLVSQLENHLGILRRKDRSTWYNQPGWLLLSLLFWPVAMYALYHTTILKGYQKVVAAILSTSLVLLNIIFDK